MVEVMESRFFTYFKKLRDYGDEMGYEVGGKTKYVKNYKRLFIKEGSIEDLVEKLIIGYLMKRGGGIFFDVFDKDMIIVNNKGEVKEVNIKKAIQKNNYTKTLLYKLIAEVIKEYGLSDMIRDTDGFKGEINERKEQRKE